MKEYQKIVQAQEQLPHFESTARQPEVLPLVYQYRSFKSFWQILKSDSFWATNARFSNDEEEQQFGMDVISTLVEDKSLTDSQNDKFGLNENYIICFCKEDDKLSQWRGYAPEGGVSMGFDFGMPRAFSIISNKSDSSDDSSNNILQYVGLDTVRYIAPKQLHQSVDEYCNYCHKELALKNPIDLSRKNETYHKEIEKKAPYIKHSGFFEEDEYRLVFRNIDGVLDDCIKYRDSESETLRYPYIVVKSALPPKSAPTCVVRVCIHKDKEKELTEKIETALKTTYPVSVQGCHLGEGIKADAGEPFCTGCILRRWATVNSYHNCRYNYDSSDVNYEYVLHEKESSVIISQGDNQKEIFEVVHRTVQTFNEKENTKISVWCEGHLPLRKITVGPCPNQKNIIEAIRHYCKHTYWLMDVEIIASTIPYRKSL